METIGGIVVISDTLVLRLAGVLPVVNFQRG